jgi:hypothetical protein
MKASTLDAAEIRKLFCLDCLGTVHEVRKIEAGDVIPDDDIRIDLGNELLPCLQHPGLVLEADDLWPYNVGYLLQAEHVSDKWRSFAFTRCSILTSHSRKHKHTLTGDHVRDLNDWVLLRLGEDSFSAGTFDVEAKNTKRRDLLPFSLRSVRLEEIVPGILVSEGCIKNL